MLVRDSPVAQASGTFSSLLGDVAAQVEGLLGDQFSRRGLDPFVAPFYAQMLVGRSRLRVNTGRKCASPPSMSSPRTWSTWRGTGSARSSVTPPCPAPTRRRRSATARRAFCPRLSAEGDIATSEENAVIQWLQELRHARQRGGPGGRRRHRSRVRAHRHQDRRGSDHAAHFANLRPTQPRQRGQRRHRRGRRARFRARVHRDPQFRCRCRRRSTSSSLCP